MKVSVLIPTYNRRHYVVDAIQSVIAQDYADMEIIVVDDGSTDATDEALAPYLSRIQLIRTKNQGPAMARNVGMQAARGDYVAFLDSDDLYYPFKVRLQAHLLDEYPDIGMVYSEFSAFNDDGFWDEFHLKKYHDSAYRRGGVDYGQLFVERKRLHELPRVGDPGSSGLEKWGERYVHFGNIYEAYLFNTVVFTNSMMFRRSLLEKTKLQRKTFGMFHDLEFALRLCGRAKVAFVDIPTYKLRYHSGQVSTTQNSQGGKVAIRIQRDLLRVARHHLRRDPDFYSRHKERVHRQLARLCRAAAIPLLSYEGGTSPEGKAYPRHARRYLAKCREYGHGESILYLLTFSPRIVRRIAFKIMSIFGTLNSRMAGP
jgi:GT2 family glycosyltransferase